MKGIIFLVLSINLAFSNLVGLKSQCLDKHVPDLNKVCIKPDYIEGCVQYKSPQECFTCSKGIFKDIQSMSYQMENVICSIPMLKTLQQILDAFKPQVTVAAATVLTDTSKKVELVL